MKRNQQSKVLSDAAKRLEQRDGWYRGWQKSGVDKIEECLCLVTAMHEARECVEVIPVGFSFIYPLSERAIAAAIEELGHIVPSTFSNKYCFSKWNDTQAESKQQVVSVLSRAADLVLTI